MSYGPRGQGAPAEEVYDLRTRGLVVYLLERGHSAQAVSEALGMSKNDVHSIARSWGVARRSNWWNSTGP